MYEFLTNSVVPNETLFVRTYRKWRSRCQNISIARQNTDQLWKKMDTGILLLLFFISPFLQKACTAGITVSTSASVSAAMFSNLSRVVVAPPLPLRSKNGVQWVREVSIAPHFEFWQLEVHHPGTYGALRLLLLRLEQHYTLNWSVWSAQVRDLEHSVSLPDSHQR